jgi:hypothetical protein
LHVPGEGDGAAKTERSEVEEVFDDVGERARDELGARIGSYVGVGRRLNFGANRRHGGSTMKSSKWVTAGGEAWEPSLSKSHFFTLATPESRAVVRLDAEMATIVRAKGLRIEKSWLSAVCYTWYLYDSCVSYTWCPTKLGLHAPAGSC